MKAKLFRLGCGMLIAALLSSAAGCGGKTDGGQTAEPDKTAVSQTASRSETSAATAEAAQPAEAGEWAGAYQAHLLTFIEGLEDNNLRNEFRFGLIYLNDDDVPELWYINGIGAHGPSYQIVTCRGGKAVGLAKEDDYFATEVGYYEKQGVFDASGSAGGMVGTARTYYQMTDSGCKTLDELTAFYKYEDEEMMGDMVLDQNGEPIVVYRINEKEVTEEEYAAFQKDYDARLGKWKSFEDAPSFPLTADSIRQNCK